jgi:hypothetical protein
MNWTTARRLVVLLVGGTIVLCGTAMIFLPGPAIVVIPVGILILGSEFAWARRLHRRLLSMAEERLRNEPGCNGQRGSSNADGSID